MPQCGSQQGKDNAGIDQITAPGPDYLPHYVRQRRIAQLGQLSSGHHTHTENRNQDINHQHTQIRYYCRSARIL